MCASTSTAVGIFAAINNVLVKNDITWDKCVSLGVDNTSVNVGRHNSLNVEASKKNEDIILMGWLCHIAHNTASKATNSFVKVANNFDVEQFLVDVYFHFDYSSKRKNLLAEFCEFCDQQYCKIIKFHSVHWLGLSTCIERVLKLFPSLKSYLLSLSPDINNGVESETRNNRLISFLHASLQPLITLNLLLQRTDPLIHILHDALFSCTSLLLSRFASLELVRQYRRGEPSRENVKAKVMDLDNVLPTSKIFVGFLVRGKINSLLDEGDISKRNKSNFYNACLEFHRTAFLYALDNFPLDHDFLKHARFLNFVDQKCTFDSALFVSEKLKRYVQFTQQQLAELEQEFLLLQSIAIEDMPQHALVEAVVRIDPKDDDKIYRFDVLWYHLFKMNIPGTTRSKFRNLFELAKVVLCIIHSNAEEESIFSRVRKNLTPRRASLEIEGTLSSIISFQVNYATSINHLRK